MGCGLYRSDGSGGYEQVFASVAAGDIATSAGARTEFALAPNGDKLRITWATPTAARPTSSGSTTPTVPATTLTDGTANAGWTKLSDPTPGTPGFASYNFCSEQCSYDMFVASPRGAPDMVWLGGQMQYDELIAFGSPAPRSNGRAVQRSGDAGLIFYAFQK